MSAGAGHDGNAPQQREHTATTSMVTKLHDSENKYRTRNRIDTHDDHIYQIARESIELPEPSSDLFSRKKTTDLPCDLLGRQLLPQKTNDADTSQQYTHDNRNTARLERCAVGYTRSIWIRFIDIHDAEQCWQGVWHST